MANEEEEKAIEETILKETENDETRSRRRKPNTN